MLFGCYPLQAGSHYDFYAAFSPRFIDSKGLWVGLLMRRAGCSERSLVVAAYSALTGLEVCVVLHSDPVLRGLRGRVVADFPRCLVIRRRDGGRVCVLKRGGLFVFKLEEGCWVLLRGEEITGSPAERVRALEKGKGVRSLVRASKKRRYTGCQSAR